MTESALSSPSDLIRAVDSSWADLQRFLLGLSETQAAASDDSGWTIKDHVTHLAVWEDSVDVVFRGRPRHEALGITETLYATASFDQINEAIKEQHAQVAFRQALEELDRVHAALRARLMDLSAAELSATVANRFPAAPRSDDRKVLDFILENTAEHFAEHLEWMKALLARSA